MVIAIWGLARIRSTIYKSKESEEEVKNVSDLRVLHQKRDHGRILLHKGHGLRRALNATQHGAHASLTNKNPHLQEL